MTSINHETNTPEAYGFDDLTIGQVFKGPGRTLSETDLMMFAKITGDEHSIHTDEQIAKAANFKGRIFHGTYGIAITMALAAGVIRLKNPMIAALGIREWEFRAPLYISDTVHVELEVIEKRITSDGRRAVISRRLRLINQDDIIAQEGIADLMVGLANEQETSS